MVATGDTFDICKACESGGSWLYEGYVVERMQYTVYYTRH